MNIKVFIVCSGLGYIRRGFESFFRGCFDALKDAREIDLHLFKGRGIASSHEWALWNVPRNGRAARICGKVVGRGGYFSEQFTFFLSLIPQLYRLRPDVVYVSDVVLANLLRKYSRCLGYRVLYCNGGPTKTEFLHRWDHVQQVSPQYLDEAVTAGIPNDKQTLLPYGLNIPASLVFPEVSSSKAVKKSLGLPLQRQLLLSVGAINTSRKRMDYLIREVAMLPEPRPYLLVLGAWEKESPEIERLAEQLLPGGFETRTVEKHEMSQYYQVADLFSLASVDEGFGLAYVEALAHGLPCIAHDYPTSRFVLGNMGIYADLTKEGSLARLIQNLDPNYISEKKAIVRHSYAYERFSWDKLRKKYVEMFQLVANKN